jgi:putative ABC transport system permease protein
MILQFFKTSFRIFTRERIYSVLNITGLATGITVALIIFLYLQQELTHDRYHRNAKNIYRVNSIYISSGKENKFALSPVSFGPRILEEFPEIVAYSRLVRMNRCIISYEDKKFNEENLFVADSGTFRVFTHTFIYGDPSTCLRSPNSIVLSEKLARRYFGDINPLGKTLLWHNASNVRTLTVTAVIKDLPENIHVKYDALIQINDPQGETRNASFYNISVYTYLLFPDNYDISEFYRKFPAFHQKYAAERGKILKQEYKAVLQPLLKTHFSKEWVFDLPNGNWSYIIAFLVIGVLVLSLSCINYLNLTTARAERRRKEISMKKILGSGRAGLIAQFIGESMLMAFIATITALGVSQFILGFTSFNELIDKNLEIAPGRNLPFLIGVIVLTVSVGLVSGLYPAFHLSNVQPLKSMNRPGRSAASLRKLLVITQMVISIGVIICTLMMKRQLEFIRNKDLGINKENLLIVPLRDTAITNHLNTLREKLAQNSSIVSVSMTNSVPASGMGNNMYRAETGNGMEENNFFTMVIGYEFLSTLGITLVSGRNFDRSFTTDPRSAFLINETLANKMGWSEPLGKKLQQNFTPDGKPYFDGVVVGVVRDFNYTSLHNAIEPLVLRVQSTEGGQLLVRMSGKDVAGIIRFIENTWKEFGVEFPLNYSFLDRNFDQLYRKDQQQNSLIKIFSWICVMISFLGLLTLASYITKNRTREIAIRKVYGASPSEVVYMLYREIILLTLVASVIAAPLAYWGTGKLLESFAYRAEFSIGIILVTMAGAVVVALATVSFHALKASFLNPSNSLKYE